MISTKYLLGMAGALMLLPSAASALTLTNNEDAEITIGADAGNTETVHKIAAGKSLDLSNDCPAGCGLTGPWGYSHLALKGDTLVLKDNILSAATN